MTGLTQNDIDVLARYAKAGNRELYWNYLSQLPGADGYGTLALGVVRNDSIPGQVANEFAQSYASTQGSQGSRFANTERTERGWDEFGKTLIQRDLEARLQQLADNRPDLALNLPGKDVMLSHDRAFEQHRLDPNCWTPRLLLQTALDKDGPQELERIWTNMLDNSAVGLPRVYNTATDAYKHMDFADATQYIAKLSVLEVIQLAEGRSTVDPNIIGTQKNFAIYSERTQNWTDVVVMQGNLATKDIDNPRRLAELNDTRELRLERQVKATQFHPDDPYRTITPSPRTVSVDPPPVEQSAATRLADIGPDHPDHALLQQVRAGVHALDAQAGRTPDEYSERMVASVMALARQNGLERADHVVLNAQTADTPAGSTVFVVQGALDDPAHLRAAMSTDAAVQAPVDQSMRLLHSANREREQFNAQHLQQQMDAQVQSPRGPMQMG